MSLVCLSIQLRGRIYVPSSEPSLGVGSCKFTKTKTSLKHTPVSSFMSTSVCVSVYVHVYVIVHVSVYVCVNPGYGMAWHGMVSPVHRGAKCSVTASDSEHSSTGVAHDRRRATFLVPSLKLQAASFKVNRQRVLASA